jgi:hypothetical protein
MVHIWSNQNLKWCPLVLAAPWNTYVLVLVSELIYMILVSELSFMIRISYRWLQCVLSAWCKSVTICVVSSEMPKVRSCVISLQALTQQANDIESTSIFSWKLNRYKIFNVSLTWAFQHRINVTVGEYNYNKWIAEQKRVVKNGVQLLTRG